MPTFQTEAYQDVTAANVTLPYARTELERNADGLYSIMNWIEPANRSAIRNGTYTNDLTPQIQNALNSGEDILFPRGTYPLFDQLTQNVQHQILRGGGDRGKTIFDIRNATFNKNAAAVLKLAPYGELTNVTIDCEQPSGSGTVTSVNTYPWLVDITSASRVRIDGLQMRRGFNGINARGNAGGANLGRIEDGTINCGISIDTAADFITLSEWESWVYVADDISQYYGLIDYMYANPGYVEFLSNDGLDITSMHLWKKRFIFNSGSQLASTIGVLKLDGGNAHMEVTGGRLVIGALNGLTDADTSPILHLGSGSPCVVVGAIALKRAELATTLTQPLVRQETGYLAVNGGTITGNTASAPEVVQAGGVMQLSNIAFDGNGASDRPNGAVYQGGGRLFMKNCHEGDTLRGGYFVELTTNDHHNISGNFFGGRSFRRPSSPIGYYEGNTGIASIVGF